MRCFVEAARLLNFRAAARAVALTPAALGQRIAQLEDAARVAAVPPHHAPGLAHRGRAGAAWSAQQALEAADACLRAARGETGRRRRTGPRYAARARHVLDRAAAAPPAAAPSAADDPPLLRFGQRSADPRPHRRDPLRGHFDALDDPKLDAVRLHREDYVFVGQPALLRRTPLRRPADAAGHTLLDERAALPLFRYWRDSAGGGDRLDFGRFVYLGTTAAIRAGVLSGDGIAVLRVSRRRRSRGGPLPPILPRVRPLHDFFRLIFRTDDPAPEPLPGGRDDDGSPPRGSVVRHRSPRETDRPTWASSDGPPARPTSMPATRMSVIGCV